MCSPISLNIMHFLIKINIFWILCFNDISSWWSYLYQNLCSSMQHLLQSFASALYYICKLFDKNSAWCLYALKQFLWNRNYVLKLERITFSDYLHIELFGSEWNLPWLWNFSGFLLTLNQFRVFFFQKIIYLIYGGNFFSIRADCAEYSSFPYPSKLFKQEDRRQQIRYFQPSCYHIQKSLCKFVKT